MVLRMLVEGLEIKVILMTCERASLRANISEIRTRSTFLQSCKELGRSVSMAESATEDRA